MIRAIDHIGIAVKDLDESLATWLVLFPGVEVHRETVADQKVDVASFQVGGVRIELTAATDEDSPIAKFLAKRGEGIHHVAFAADAVNDELQRLEAGGIKLINSAAVPGAHDKLIGFLHPKSTGGVLMELCQDRPTAGAENAADA